MPTSPSPASPSVSPIAEAPEATPQERNPKEVRAGFYRVRDAMRAMDLPAMRAIVDEASAKLSALCNGERWHMTIPVQATDTDMVLGRAIDLAEKLIDDLAERITEADSASLAQRSDDSPSVVTSLRRDPEPPTRAVRDEIQSRYFPTTTGRECERCKEPLSVFEDDGESDLCLPCARNLAHAFMTSRLTSGGSDDRAGVEPDGDVLTEEERDALQHVLKYCSRTDAAGARKWKIANVAIARLSGRESA